ncbi:MAG: hypothetical protein GXY37_09545 [Chloroflexi bacterium]|nr:hypothetical protein [Chloroflexota bacterium]
MPKTHLRFLMCALAVALLLGACGKGREPQTAAPSAPPEIALPTPMVDISEAPDVEAAAQAYLAFWKAEDYPSMYSMVSRLTRDAFDEETFTKKHLDAAIALTMKSLDTAILSYLLKPDTAQVNYHITYETNLLGKIEREPVMNLILEDGTWHVQWEGGMILPELKGGNVLAIDYTTPTRGNIYAANDYPLVAQAEAIAISVVAGKVDPATEGDMVSLLANLTGQSEEQVRVRYIYAQPEWKQPIGDVSLETAQRYMSQLTSYPAVILDTFKARYYTDHGIAPHAIGYVQSIFPEEMQAYRRMGYAGDEKVGKQGIEAWGEEYLSGTHGINVYVKDPSGQIVTRLGTVKSKPSASIYTTIDSQLQYWLQRSMGDLKGAIAVVERDTGKVLAMVSNPGFDPNIFEPTSGVRDQLTAVTSDPNLPLFNRAAQGVYPPGSVFKIVTMAAALETGVFTPTYPYNCGSTWEEAGYTLYDWTHDKGFAASGLLTLQEGLMRSCNPWFWHIAWVLWNDGYRTALPDVAERFGLGQSTGIEIPDFAGQVPYPEDVNDYVQMAIGQSTLQNSPLQVAMYVAAVGNGGTLYQPTLINRIAPIDGSADIYTFEPKVRATLNITQENIEAIQEAMVWAVKNRRGTAEYQLGGLPYKLAGKTGTAENPLGDSHAWFAGYTWNNNPNKPDIAVAIILENAGEGSEMAAPLFRRVVQLYNSNYSNAGGTMPWEDRPYVPATDDDE